MSEPKYALGPSYDDKFAGMSDRARIVELEQQLAEQKRLADPLTKAMYKEMSARHSEVCSQLTELRDAAQEAVDTVCLPGPGSYYYSALDWAAMKALEAALLKQEGE